MVTTEPQPAPPDTLSALLDAADDDEDATVRRLAHRVGLLWECGDCHHDNPGDLTGCACCPVDHCQPEDIDCTPDYDEPCGRVHPTQVFVCTRRPGHTGRQHVAGNGRLVTAVWPGDGNGGW